MYRSIVLLVAGAATLCAFSLSAQEAVLSQEYGSGVHSYFAGNYVKAYEQLTTAIDGGMKDPRAFYFRGLAMLNLGRPQDARLDFRAGAALEANDVNNLYNVGKSLERIQGSARAELEAYRVDARMRKFELEERLQRARYEKTASQREADIDRLANGPKKPTATAGGEDDDPFALPGDQPKKPVAKKAPPKASAEDDPFGSDEDQAPDANAPEKKPGKVDKKPSKTAKKSSGDSDPFAKPAEKPEGSDGGNSKGKKKGSLIGGVGKAIGKAIGGNNSGGNNSGGNGGAKGDSGKDPDPFAP
jgi:hypothetical protein